MHPESYRLAVAVCLKAIGEEDVEAAVEEHPDKVGWSVLRMAVGWVQGRFEEWLLVALC